MNEPKCDNYWDPCRPSLNRAGRVCLQPGLQPPQQGVLDAAPPVSKAWEPVSSAKTGTLSRLPPRLHSR